MPQVSTPPAYTHAILINIGRRRRISGIYAYSVLAESLLLVMLATLCLSERPGSLCLVYGLSFLMGLQNAKVTRISNARIRTTHVTGMLTDIGLELGNLAASVSQYHDATQRLQNAGNRRKLLLHSFTIGCFIAGGVIGVIAFRTVGPSFLFVVSAALLLLALIGLSAEPNSAKVAGSARQSPKVFCFFFSKKKTFTSSRP